MKKTVYILLLACTVLACSESDPAHDANSYVDNLDNATEMANGRFEQVKWLIGTWQSDDGNQIEVWQQSGNDFLSGEGFGLTDGDTTFREQLRIYRQDNEWYYGAIVPDQNRGKMIPFKLVKSDGNQLQFSNSDHDFPTEIHYTYFPADSCKVKVSNTSKGFSYMLYRVQP